MGLSRRDGDVMSIERSKKVLAYEKAVSDQGYADRRVAKLLDDPELATLLAIDKTQSSCFHKWETVEKGKKTMEGWNNHRPYEYQGTFRIQQCEHCDARREEEYDESRATQDA